MTAIAALMHSIARQKLSKTLTAYADDIILFTASVVHLNKTLKICQSQGEMLDVGFNPKKSCLFSVGKRLQGPVGQLCVLVMGTLHG